MERAQSHSQLPPPCCEIEDYYSRDAFSLSLKQTFQSETEVESSKAIAMPVMIIGTNNWEEKMTSMKVMLEKLVKESEKKSVHQIAGGRDC